MAAWNLAKLGEKSPAGEGAAARARDVAARRPHRAVPADGAGRRPVGGKGSPWAAILDTGRKAAAAQTSRCAFPDHSIVALAGSDWGKRLLSAQERQQRVRRPRRAASSGCAVPCLSMGGLAKIGVRQLAPEGEPMQATRSVVVSDERAVEAAPGPLPKPPGRPPAEPIIIRRHPGSARTWRSKGRTTWTRTRAARSGGRRLGFPTNRHQRRRSSARSVVIFALPPTVARKSAVSKNSRRTVAS